MKGSGVRWAISIGMLTLGFTLAASGGMAARSTVRSSKVPVLVYHSHRILGNTYETNDHIALRHDLKTIHAEGFRIIPLSWVVEWVLGRRNESTVQKSVAITFDDGSDFDYYDLVHPQHGPQRSFYNILRDFQAEFGDSAQPTLHASSFVIASPGARRELDSRNFSGRNWMTDGWWQKANSSGIMRVYSHSWDHNHPDVSVVCEENQVKGLFSVIDTYAECQCEVNQAAEYIHQKIHPAWPDLFAYPWGDSSDYMRTVWFLAFHDQHRTLAAFGASGGYVTRASSRWDLPRFVSSSPVQGWQSPSGLISILDGAQ